MTETNSIQLESLRKSYGRKTIFDQLDLKLSPGLYFVKGENGTGKSTLLKLIAGVEAPDSGLVSIYGNSVARQRLSTNLKRTFVPDQPVFFDYCRAEEIFSLFSSLYGLDSLAQSIQIQTWDLVEIWMQSWRTLSLGQKKRVFLAGLLLSQVPIWTLDEPTNALDSRFRQVLIQQIEMQIISGHTVILSSHDLVPEDFVSIGARTHVLRLEAFQGVTRVNSELLG